MGVTRDPWRAASPIKETQCLKDMQGRVLTTLAGDRQGGSCLCYTKLSESCRRLGLANRQGHSPLSLFRVPGRKHQATPTQIPYLPPLPAAFISETPSAGGWKDMPNPSQARWKQASHEAVVGDCVRGSRTYFQSWCLPHMKTIWFQRSSRDIWGPLSSPGTQRWVTGAETYTVGF